MVEIQEDVKRMSLAIPRPLYNKLQATIPWGVRSHFLRKLIEIALGRIERGGFEVVGAILADEYDPLQRRESNG